MTLQAIADTLNAEGSRQSAAVGIGATQVFRRSWVTSAPGDEDSAHTFRRTSPAHKARRQSHSGQVTLWTE